PTQRSAKGWRATSAAVPGTRTSSGPCVTRQQPSRSRCREEGDPMTAVQEREVGAPRKRKEDARLITGRTMWTENITLPGMLHLAILRSPVAHARITGVDVSAALREPGVVAAFSGRDLAGDQPGLPCAWPVTEDIVLPDHPPVAVDEVRHVGEAGAGVVPRARDAALRAG